MAQPIPCGCAICELRLDFDLDQHLISEIEKHNCVIFAGSGISTETRHTHPDTLYETLRENLKVDGDQKFWEVVDLFEAQPNGRQKLIQIIRDRFNYIESFRDLLKNATRFHQELGNAPYFGSIITTNWDTYFEDVIGATPFVYDADIPFWESAERPVLKIHGSIDNFSSLVASSDDYKICEQRLRDGALGAVLKQMFATKTCIFCGYSARDDDFRKIFSTIREGLGQFARNHYLISPFISDEESEELFESLGIISIRTDASYFLQTAKEHMQEKFCFSKDEYFDEIADQLVIFRKMHHDFVKSYSPQDHPHLIYATAYQDGVIHAFERIIDRALTGEFADLHKVQHRIAGYEQKIAECRRSRNYWDYAYFQGYQNGLVQFVVANESGADEITSIPECFHPGQGEICLRKFDELVRPNPEIHKAALAEARKLTERFASNDLIVQHMPWG